MATAKVAEAKTYTKEQLLESQKYKGKRDMLSALLDERKKYALDEVDTIMGNYMKGMVK